MMSNVMGNGRTGYIKKQIFLSLGLFFSFSQLNAMCPQTVGVVTPGEAIWRVTSRIGEAVNVIQSQLCAIDVVSSSTTGIDCTFVFGQADIGTGGVYIITAPGTYCMKENVTFNTGSAITVNSNDVTIELEGHTIEGQASGSTGIELGGGIQNVIVKNGIIENVAGFGINDTPGHSATLNNIVIQDVNFNTNDGPAISFDQASAATPDVDGMLIQNCNAFNSGGIVVQGISAIVQGCEVVDSNGNNNAIITLGGSVSKPLGSSFLIQDCIVTSESSQFTRISIGRVASGIIRDCISQGSVFSSGGNIGSIFMTDCQNAVISDCVVQGNQVTPSGGGNRTFGVGLVSGGVTTNAVIERCSVSGSEVGFKIFNFFGTGVGIFRSVKFIDCVAEHNLNYGFFLEATTSPGFSATSLENIVFRGCCAQANGLSGFFAFSNGLYAGPIHKLIFEGCVAQDNNGDGYASFNTQPSLALSPRDMEFVNCVAQGNKGGVDANNSITFFGDGFGMSSAFRPFAFLGSQFGVICQDCFAQSNARHGFALIRVLDSKVIDCCALNNTGTGISNAHAGPGDPATNVILGNAAFNNVGGDITVGDPSLIISRSLVGGLAGATRWVNAVS
jgi:hypothetical protein